MKRHAAVVVGRYFLGFIKFAESVVNYRVGQKKTVPLRCSVCITAAFV